MNRIPTRLLPFVAASAALHMIVLVAGPDPLMVATAPAGSGHEVSVRLEAAAPAGAAAASGPMGTSETSRSRPTHRTQPPTPDASTLAQADRPTAHGSKSSVSEQETQPVQPREVAAEQRENPPARDAASPEPTHEPAERVVRTQTPATGTHRTSSKAQRAEARAAIVAELARHFRYPRLAQQRGWEGTVVLTVRILPDGRLDQVGIKRSSGRALLDRAAVRALVHVRRLPEFADRVGREGLALEIPVTYRLEAA